MVTKGYNLYKTLIINTLLSRKKNNASRQRIMVEAVTLFLSIKGRINFQQLERYGKYSEQRYRIQFEKPFDFMAFNSGLVQQHGSGHYIIALDPSFIAKSGKKTPGIGYFWSGQAARTKRGPSKPTEMIRSNAVAAGPATAMPARTGPCPGRPVSRN